MSKITQDHLGQLIMTGIKSTSLDETEKDFLQNEEIGGVILFAHNYESPRQLASLTNSIQLLRNERPLFISVDQEGGRVRRFKTHFTQWPSMQSLARLNSPKIIFEIHSIISQELKATGVNWNFSPVCDVLNDQTTNAIGDRSFGHDPENVGHLITAAIRGMAANGLISCAKHFPGHGSSSVDSHVNLPTLTQSMAQLESFDLIPFYKAAKSKVETIMVGHLLVPDMDPHFCASLSKKMITHLRSILRFNRLVVSDDLDMQGITKNYGLEETPLLAINAGNNLLIYRSMDSARVALESLKKAYMVKSLDKTMVSDSISLINKTKDIYLKNYTPIDILRQGDFSEVVGTTGSQEYLKEILEKLSALGH